MWKSQEKERQRIAPRKNIPITTFSWTGATKDMLGRNIYIRPRNRKNRQPAERQTGTERQVNIHQAQEQEEQTACTQTGTERQTG